MQVLGLDVGSVSISLVCLDQDGTLRWERYLLHQGNVKDGLSKVLQGVDMKEVQGIAAPAGKVQMHRQVHQFDPQVSLMRACRWSDLEARSILHVGAERFFHISLDGKGHYHSTSHSSSCAAGTGSFLDQQALRLRLRDTAHLSELARKNRSPIPDIAARCSVFAKTDLIHAQQMGYGLEAICDSLCKGLADNITDTLFTASRPDPPILMTGGVSRNAAVVGHLEALLERKIILGEHSQHFPAIGAALLLLEELEKGKVSPGLSPRMEVLAPSAGKTYEYAPLESRGEAGAASSMRRYNYTSSYALHGMEVQVDRFDLEAQASMSLYLGMDIGSTSTKAVLTDARARPLAGFYTYTLGQPLQAAQALLEAIEHLMKEEFIQVEILAFGTTGSGRKFIGGILGADQVLDEITAHARAAYALNPLCDTIIEIGGQDAKFTQMKDGVVTFSHMNTVCAAGTGSFIEELAGRLGVKLEDYENLALGTPAPLASDRCTVFMERDINQLLSLGYSVREVLATVIHSVRENYLKKVASEAHIGQEVCFQGATARNRALVAAFEQRLDREIFVSPLCHLTGALGTALILKEEHEGASRFRGLELYRQRIPVETETCELCLNRCTISVAQVKGETLAYGFQCGRDYETQRKVKKRGEAMELGRVRKNVRKKVCGIPDKRKDTQARIGIPDALHLVEDLPFWTRFFRELDIPVVTSAAYRDSLKAGKKIAGAEFCAPIDAMYGHVRYLKQNCEAVFMPVYLEGREKVSGKDQNFCYYTQFSTSLAFTLDGQDLPGKLLSPMLNFHRKGDHNARVLLKELRPFREDLTLALVKKALQGARELDQVYRMALRESFRDSFSREKDVSVAMLGRPYVLLPESLNKGIPGLFAAQGIRSYYQDMLPVQPGKDEAFEALLKKIPWHFAANILRAAEEICRTPGLYPVLVTAFKCAPDSFIIEYFKALMNLFQKPYLIIQIDEHDSNTGYETRIEAALRSFRNHAAQGMRVSAPDLGGLLPAVETRVEGKTLLIPNWDSDVSPLVAANLRRAGLDARLLESSEMGIRRSMAHNTGQCLPINIIAQDYIDYIRKYQLDPSRTILWMMESKMTCNLRQYPFYIKRILENSGEGLEKAAVYSGELTHREMPLNVTYYAYFVYMLGGLFRKTACRIRPYELIGGETDRVYQEVHEILLKAFSGEMPVEEALKQGVTLFESIEYDSSFRKPLVAIFGDFYVRDNDVMNQDLVRAIEQAGGEALATPYHDFAKLTIENIFRRARMRGEHVQTGFNRIILNILKFMDDRYYKPFVPFLGDAPLIRPLELEKRLEDFQVDLFHSGESYDNLLKIFYIVENFPNVALFVQTNPSFCCPALVTEAMTGKIREITGVPVVTITYDGTSDRMNDVIVPYIQEAGLEKE